VTLGSSQAALNITHLIVGHTISAGGRLWRRCDGDVLGVDVAIYMVRAICLPACDTVSRCRHAWAQ
jgi:hypothetical protein